MKTANYYPTGKICCSSDSYTILHKCIQFLRCLFVSDTNLCTQQQYSKPCSQKSWEFTSWYAALSLIFHSDDDQLESIAIRQELHWESNKTKTQLIISACLYLNEVLPSYWQNLGLLLISKSCGIIIQLSFHLFCLVMYDHSALGFSVLFAHKSTKVLWRSKADWELNRDPVIY